MSDTKSKTVKTASSKFSLIELLTILLLVGLIFVFVVPVNQAGVSQRRVQEAIGTIQMIGEASETFKNDPNNGYYPIDISQLNLGQQIESNYFEFSVVSDDSTVVAVTKPAFGKKGAAIVYSLTRKNYRIGRGDNDQISRKFINENWLP